MKLTLPKEVMAGLPEPGSDGVIRATVGLKMEDGGVELVEVNDQPVPTGDAEEDAAEGETEATEEESDTPDLGAMAQDIYGPSM